MKKTIPILVVLLLLGGCAVSYKGVRSTPHCVFSDIKGHETTILKHITLDYDYTVGAGTINFKGTIDCNNVHSDYRWEEADITLQIMFLDATDTFSAMHTYVFLDNDEFCGNAPPKEFDMTFPYFGRYNGVWFGYSIQMRGF